MDDIDERPAVPSVIPSSGWRVNFHGGHPLALPWRGLAVLELHLQD